MRLSLLAVGPAKPGPETDIIHDYTKRFRGMAGSIGLSGIDMISVKSGGGLQREGDRLLAKLPTGSRILRLDEHGPSFTSIKFAETIAKWRDEGDRSLVFMIGGAEGYSDAVKRAMPQTLALGPQTWPHMLARVMLVEQIYRAASILAGSPYHKV